MQSETFRFRLGRFSCLAIRDHAAVYPVAMFLSNLPSEQYETCLVQRGQQPQHIELPYTCILLDAGVERLLIDTGIGPYATGDTPGRLVPLLRAAGVEPEAVGTVVLSHGHGDHVGGCLNADGKAAFPNARYVMFRKEWDFWMSNPTLAELPIDQTMRTAMITCAQHTLSGVGAQLDLVDPDTEIVDGITALAAFGHSPGQMALDINSEGQRMLFIADVVVLPLHLEYPHAIGITDHRPGEMVATRRRLLEKAARERCLVATSHLQFPGLGYVMTDGDSWIWQSIGSIRRACPS